MAILSGLLAVAEPTGMWETIIKAFEGFSNNYILAIILLTVIIRIIWAPIDTLNKKMSQKMTVNQAKMQPELDKLKAKYANNPQLLKQKQNELYSKYNTGSVGSCVFMLIFIALNFAIFLTLWQGLNSMSVYKTYESYDNLKYEYANCLNLTDEYLKADPNNYEIFKDYENLKFVISEDKKSIKLVQDIQREDGTIYEKVIFSALYNKNFEVKENEEVKVSNNAYIVNLIETYISKSDSEEQQAKYIGDTVLIEEVKNEADEVVTQSLDLSQAVQNVAMKAVEVEYDLTQDKFLWIQSIWIADSPLQNSIFEYDSFERSVGAANLEENEKEIYKAFMTQLRIDRGRVNGYFILPILCVAITFLSMWLSTRKKKGEPASAQQTGKITKIIMPIIFGMFAIFYSSVFAIYMVVGQMINTLLIPLQNLILDKWNDHDNKKKKDKVEVVEYSRKF